MKNLRTIAALGALLVLSAFTFKSSVSWKISEGYTIKFTSDDPTGVFTKMSGDIVFDANDLENARFDVKVDVNSINTGNGMQNKHAISAKWFDAETYPTINFVSEKFSKTTKGYTVSGTMELHGVKKPFDIPFTFKNNVFEAAFPVDRTVFGIGKPGGKVPNEMAVEVAVPVTK